ncbi:MAG: DNA internalization-related competence protein ComEC/Rec2 [Thermodesulfobacteriota bacterium]
MNRTFRLPLIPVFIAYMIGLYLGHFDLSFPSQGFFLFLLALLPLWILFMIMRRTGWGSWVTLVFFFLLGIFSLHTYLHLPHSPSHISHFTGFDGIVLEGILDRPPESSRGGTQLLIKSQKIILSNRHVPVEGHALLFLKEENGSFHVGDRLRFLCRLYPPHGFRNPGGFSYERYLTFERIHAIGFLSVKKGWVKTGEGFKNPFLLRMEGWRDHIRNFLQKKADPRYSGIFEALVLGEQGNIPEEVKEDFIATGIAHLLAISGDHLGIVALLSFSLFIWIMKRSEFLLLSISVKKWAATLTIPCILLYTFIAGGGISVIRATIMVITFFFSILFNRERNLLHTLALAAFLILIVSPPSLFDVSFQLSFLAVLSILYLVPRILTELKREGIPLPQKASWKQNLWIYLKLSFLVTTVATLGTAPFVALHFNRISPIGWVTNLFAIPWVGFLIVPLSLIASLFSFFLSPLATFLIHINDFFTLVLLKVVAFFASFPFASFFVSTPTVLEIVLFYLLLFIVVHLRKGRRIRYIFVGLCLTLICDLAYWNFKDSFQKNLTLTFIDVGHGDSILIEFPKGKRMLIDGGGLHEDRFDIGKNVIAPFLWKKKIQRIDYLVLTHPDPDHLKGLNFIASHFSIGQFWDNGLRGDSESYLNLEKTILKKKIERFSLNEKISPQTINGVQISILNPPVRNEFYKGNQNPMFLNNQSLVMKLHFKEIRVLLTGDIEEEAEYRMMRRDIPLKSDILKIPHHGSSSSSTPLFLERVKPTYAILSVGERNIAKLPHPEVLRRYHQQGAKIFRTDKHGAIFVITDGERIEVNPFLNKD